MAPSTPASGARRDWEPGVRVRRKLAAAAGDAARAKPQPSVQDSGFSTETSCGKVTNSQHYWSQRNYIVSVAFQQRPTFTYTRLTRNALLGRSFILRLRVRLGIPVAPTRGRAVGSTRRHPAQGHPSTRRGRTTAR